MDEVFNISKSHELTEIDINISKLIYSVRGKQVIMDSDLAMLYQVETKKFNQAVKRNINRFPEQFRFQLTKKEYEDLRSQNVTSNGKGGRRYLPYVFTESGIAMLSAVLNSDIAISVSIRIMDEFVRMRHIMANNALMFEKINAIELKQLEYQKDTDEKFGRIFEYMANHEEDNQKIFYDGQIFDAFSFLADIIGHAKKKIILIDGYIDVITLNILSKKNAGVNVLAYTFPSARITTQDINNFNAQYPTLTVKKTTAFHDRFLIIDGVEGYHIGASLKDAGKKCFGMNKIEGTDAVKDIMKKAQQTGT